MKKSKKSKYSLLTIILFSFCSFVNASDQWKTVKNELYSFSVPSNWERSSPLGIGKDEFTPSERKTNTFHRYFLSWSSPIINGNFSELISINIESYKRLDNKALSIVDIEKSEMSKLEKATKILSRKEISASSGEKRFIINEISTTISMKSESRKEQNYRIYLLSQAGNMVHCLVVFTSEKIYLLPETQQVINEILDSFTINSSKK